MSNIHQLLRALESRPGVDQQIAVLHELNTALTMASGHPSQNRVGGVIQALVPLLSWSNNEVVLLAIRALITCIDITPRTATSLVESGAVTPMCRRLLKIQDMDVAEACLKCLHLLSKDNPRAVLEAGGAKACLAFFDFFPLELQQNALSTVARLVAPGVCGRREDIRRAREILPFLRECLQKQQAGGAVAGGLSVGFHGGGIGVAGSGSGGDVRRSSTASGGGTLRGKDSASDASQMASLCLERMVVSFSTPIESTTERRSVSRKLRRSRSNFSFRAPPRPCERQRPPSLRVANENPAPGTSETPSDPLGAPAVTEAAATADDREPVAKGSKPKLATEREEGQNDREEEALTPEDVGDTPSPSLSSPSSPSSPGDGGGSGNGPKGESRPPAENKGEGMPTDEGGSAADGEGETSAGAAAAASSSYSVLMKGKGKARASNVGASSSAPPSLPAVSDGGARNEEWIAAISSADGGVALGDPLVDDGSMVDDAREMAIESLVEMSQKGNRAACDEKDVPPAVDAASAMTMATVGDGLLDVVGFLGMEVDGDEGGEKGDVEKEAVKTNVGDGRSERTCAGAEDFYYDLDVRAAGTQSSCKAPMAAPHGGKKKEQGRLAGGLRAWQVAFVLEIAEGGVLSAWSKTLEDSVKALEGANGDLAPGWRLQSRLLSTIARVVSAAPVAVQALFDVGMPRLLRRILADYVRCDLVTMGAPSGIGSANSEARWKPSTLADSLIGEERLLAALGLATAMLPPPSGKAKDSKASSSRRGKGTTRSRGSATAATTLSSCVRAVEGEPKSMDVDESPDGCQDAGRLALEGLGEDSVTGEKMNDSDGGDCTDDEGLPPDLEQAAVAAAVAAAGKRRKEKRGGGSIGRGHFGARDAYEAGGDGGVEETKVAAQGMGKRSPAAATATADGTGGPSEDANRGGGGPDGDAWNLAIDPRTMAKTNSSVSSPSLLPAIGGSEVGEEHRQHMTGVEGPTANAAAPRYDAREENNGVGVSANGDPAETAQAQARARRVAEVALKAAAADAAAAASAARAAREAAAAAAAGASGAEWACSACTFINHGSGFGRVCEVCGTPNASAVAAVTAGEAGVFFGGAALEARLQARFRGGRGVGSSGGGMSIWESDAMGGDDDGADDGSGIPGFPPHWHRGVGAGRGGGNPETVDSRNQAEAAVEEDHEDEDDDKNSDKFAPDDKVFVRLRHVYGQDEGLFHEFSRELLAPLLRLVPSGLSSPEAVRLVAAALVSLRQNSVECLLRKEFAEELAAALYRLLSKREHALRTGALAVAKAVLQSRSPEELGEASFSRGKSAGTAGGQEMKSFPPPSASATDRAVYYREVFARHGVLKLMEGSHGEHPSPAFDAEVLRAPSTSSSSSGSPQPLHPTLVNLCGIAARLDPSLPPDPRRLDCVDQNNGDRHGGGRLPRTAKDEEVVVSPAGEQSTSKGKGKAVCPQGGERKETGGSSSCVSSGLSLRGVPGDGPGPKKFAAWDALAKENGFKGGKDGDGSDISLAFSDLTRTLKGHLGGVTTFEAEESGVLRALLRALLNGARGNGSSLGALAAGEESAESMPEEYTAPCRKQTHVAPSEGVHWKGDGGENPPSSFDNGLAPMEAEPVGAVESPEGYGVASMVTPSGSSETPGATFIKREFVDPDEAQLIPVAALQPSPSSPRREADSTMVAATDGDVRSGSEASSSEVLDWRGAAVGTRLTGSDFYLEVGKALLTPDEDGRLPMESLISTTQGCLQALTDDVVVVHHGGDTEAAHYRSLVRPFTVLLSPGSCPPRASPAVPDDHASSHSSEPRPGSAAGVKDEILLSLSGSAAGDDGGDAEEVPKCTAPANAAAAAIAASTGGRIGGSSMDSDSGVSTTGVGRDPNACAAVTETKMRGATKEEGDSAPQQQPSTSLGVSTSTFSVRAGETRKGGRREAAIAERMEAQAGLLKSLSVGLHPVLLVEPLTTVREVIKWYTVQLGKAFKLHRRRQRQERQRAAQEEAQSRVIAAAAAAASALAAAASATEAATPSADSLDAHGGSCSSSATTVGEGTDRPEKKPRSSSPNIATPLLTTSEGSPIPDESPVTTRGKAATAANTGSGWNTPKRMLPDRAAKRNSGLAHSSGSKTFRGARKTRVSRRNSTSSLSSSVSGHAGGDSDMMAAQEAKGESIDIELAVSRATDAAAAAPPAGADGDGGAAASTAALSSVGQRAAKRRRASSTRAEAEAASGEEGEGGGEGGSSTPRSGRGPASSRSSSRSRVNESTAATVKTEEDEGSNTRLRKRWKVEGRGSSSGVVMAAGSIAAPSPASGSSQGSVPGLGKKKGSTVGGGGMESGEGGGSAGGKSKLEPTRLKPGREVFCCFRPSQGEDRPGMWYHGTVGVHHRDGTLDVRFDDGDLRINIPRSHVTITLPSVVQVRQEKRPWCNLWSPEQQQAFPAAISTVFPGSGAGGPSAATATETATAAMETSLKVEEEPTHPVDGSTGGGGVDGDHAQERPGTVDTLSQSFARLAAEETREEMHRAAAASSRSPRHRRRSRRRSNSTPPSPSTSTKPDPVPPPPSIFRGVQTASAAAEAASASSSGTRSTKEARAPSTGPPPVSSSRSGAGGPSSGNMDAAAALERELTLLRHARSMQDARNVVGGFGLGLGGGLDECGSQGGVTSALATGAWPAELQEAAAAAGLALPPFPGGRGRGGVLPPSGHGLSGVGGRASGTTLRMTIPGMVDEDSPAGPGVRIQLMSTRRDAPPRPAPGPSSAPESSSSAARQDPGASESRPSETPGEDGSSRNIDGGVEEKKGACDGQRSLSPTRGQPGATSGGGVEGGVAPLGKGEQESKEGDIGGVSSSPSMSASGSGSRLASAPPAVASTRGETAAATPSAAAEATSTATEGRPVTRQSSAAPSAGGGGSSSSEPTAAAAPGRRSSKRKRSTSGNAGGSGVAGDSVAADASAGAAVDGRVLRRASTSSWASTTKSRREPQAYLDRSSTSDELDEPVGIKGWFSAEYLDYKIGARGHPQSGTNSSSSSRSRSRSTTGRKTRASAAAAAAASSISRCSSAPPEPVAAVSRRGDEDDAEAEPKHSKRRSSLARGSGARSRAASTRRRRASTSPASAHADRNTLPMIPMFPPRGASSAGGVTSQAPARSMGGTEADEASAVGRSKNGGGEGESAGGSRDSVRFPRLQWTLRYHWDAASAGNGDEKRVTDVDVTRGEISKGATIFEAVQLLMFKHSQETEGNVPRTSNWDLFKHRSMRVPLEQWGKSITLEFSPRRPKSSSISQVEGVSEAGVGARQSAATQQEESASAATTVPSSISPLPTAETPTTMETPTPGRKIRGSSKGDGTKRKNEKESRAKPFKVRKGANASPSGGVQVYELLSVLTPGATPLDARLTSLRALLEGGGIGAGLRFGEHMCLLAALQAFCEEWGPLRKRLALKGQVDDDVPDPHPSVLHDLAKRCVVAGLQRKVSRQACSPLALCSGSLPSWCVRLPAEFPTLFSLETRLALYKKTAFGMARAVAHIQKKAKNVEDQPQGSGSSESPNEMMVELAGVAGRGGGLLGHGGPDAAPTPLPELLRQLGRLGRLTVLLSRDSVLEMATFLFGLLVNGQQQPPHQRSIQPPASSGPEAGSSENRHHTGRASAPGRLGGGGGVVGGAGAGVRGFGGGGSGSSSRLGYGDFDVYNDDDDENYDSEDDGENFDGEEKSMTHEKNDEGGDGGGGVADMELDEDVLSDAEEPDAGHGHGLPQQAEQPQPPLPSEAGDGSSAVTNAAENKDGNTGHGEEASRGRWALKDRRVATVEASVPPQHAGRQAENLADTESMLLVEFAGETGHGTGPTLEFYSLVCRELVRKGLGMWRGDDVSHSPPQRAAHSSAVRNGHEEKSKTSPTPEGLDGSEAGESGGKGSASREVEGGDGTGAFSQQDDMAVEEENPFLQVGPEGLFPAPLDVRNRAVCASVEARFRLLGRVMGKALKDGRMLDLPLALPLCSLIVGLRRHFGTPSPAAGSPGEGEDGGRGRFTTMEGGGLRGNAKPLTLADVGLVDAALGRSLESVAKLAEEVQRAKAFEEMNHDGRLSSGQGGPEKLPSPPPRSVSELEACAGALCLSWSLPGCPWYELKPGGANEDVAALDLAEWVHEVTRVFLVDSIVKQVEALVKGVSEVMDPSKLSLLTAPELQRLVGGEAVGGAGGDSEWEYHRIMRSLVCRHGYSVDSPQVKWLAQVMASLDHAGRRKFLRFVTGTPRLPIGGFAALRPRLTVVKKEVGSTLGGTPDTHLPSCSTCQVYLKLPAYTSKQALEAKLLHAITEGQDHFALD